MELDEAMRTQNACRYYTEDPVPDEVLYRAVELARFAPNGGNRGAVSFIFVRDSRLRRQLGQWYLPLWEQVHRASAAGREAVTSGAEYPQSVRVNFTDPERTMADTDQFARRFGEHPVIIVVCADLALVHPTDTGLGRLSIVGGGSVYPMVQNLCLALRAQGVGTALTTLLVAREADVKGLLGIPDHISTACHIVAGYPARPFPGKLRRPDPSELAFADRWGQELSARLPPPRGRPLPGREFRARPGDCDGKLLYSLPFTDLDGYSRAPSLPVRWFPDTRLPRLRGRGHRGRPGRRVPGPLAADLPWWQGPRQCPRR